jgi:hypothetical protein
VAESLLTWDKPVSVVQVLGLALSHVAGETDFVVRCEHKAGPFDVEPLGYGRELVMNFWVSRAPQTRIPPHQHGE